MPTDAFTVGLGCAFLVVLLALYFVPAFIALLRSHPQWAAIGALNLLLGWSLIGWVIALVWSLTAVRRA